MNKIKLTRENIERLNGFCARVQDADYIEIEIDNLGGIHYRAVFENNAYRDGYKIGYIPITKQKLTQLLNEVKDDPSQ